MFNYYYPKYIKYNNDFLLFFDIFIKNNDLYLIIPNYENFIFEENKLILILNNNQLKLTEIIKYIEYEGIIILKYNIYSELNINNQIKIIYDKIKTFLNIEINIMDRINILNDNLCISTLFKDDYYLLDTWIDFYSNKNINDFYLYYNGEIDKIKNKLEKILKKYKDLNITIIEWNFKYWNNTTKYKHHAQTGMLNHCLYYYAKNFNYWLNIDLDEYINNIHNNNLHSNNLHSNNLHSNNYDIYLYNNRWAKLENNIKFDNYINLYKTKFYLGNLQSYSKKETRESLDSLIKSKSLDSDETREYKPQDILNFIKKNKNKVYLLINRTKWIINTNKFNAVGIHLPKFNFNKKYNIYNDNLWFAHFSNWTKSNVRNHFFEDNYILDNHFHSSS
jgi:hypothetical protein